LSGVPTVQPLAALVGPTASGKTEAGLAVAKAIGAEICSVDSMLVYRGMDVGTAKPTSAQRAIVPHHLIDLAEPSERFTVARFQRLALDVVEEVRGRGAVPMLVGGSGLYFRAVADELAFPGEDPAVRGELEAEADAAGVGALYRRLEELDPVAAAKIDPNNVRRVVRALEVPAITGTPFSTFAGAWEWYDRDRVRVAGIHIEAATLAARIADRASAMFAAGWLEEVRGLVDRGLGGWLTSSRAIGYAELSKHLDGRLSLEEAWEGTVRRTKNLARRQMAWFRRDPRVRWFEAGERGALDVADDVRAFLQEP
jgi:tRNA dimethylallyltransferase